MAPGDRSSKGPKQRLVIGLVAGVIGLVGVGVGTYFGIRAISTLEEADADCAKPGGCSDVGLSATKQPVEPRTVRRWHSSSERALASASSS